jgi:hypothetical protein
MRTITCINVLAWGAFVWIGRGLLANVAAQNIAGYPNHRQSVYYIYIPAGMVVVALGANAVARIRTLKYVALVAEILVLAAVLPFFSLYTGGV